MINKNAIIASFVLTYGDLLKYLSYVKIRVLGSNTYCDLYCNFESKYDFYKIRKLISFENNFVVSNIKHGYIILTFKVDAKYENMLVYYAHEDYDCFTADKIKRLNELTKKKNPATQTSSRVLFLIITFI